MPKYIYKVQTDRVIMPTTGEIRFGSSILSWAVLNGKLTASKAASVAAVASPNATDLPTALTLVNELKAQVNTLIAGQKTAAQML